MEVISSKSFEEDSSDEDNNPNDNYNYNSEPFYENYSQNKLDYNNISEDDELDNNDNENNSNDMEINRINEINELDEDEEETDGNMDNNIDEHYEENEISNSVKNVENNTINTIDEENDEYNENSYNTNNNKSNNNIDNICNYNIPIENTLNYPNIHMLFDNGANKQMPFVFFENDKYVISEDVKKLFNQIGNNKIGIISFLGQYHSKDDKLFLLNKIISKNSEIELLDNQQKNNKGILIYSKPLIVKNNSCDEEFPCFVIDYYNLDINVNKDEINHESKIFLIIILISSLLIFNSINNIDDNSLINMSFILNLIKTIKLKGTLEEENNSEIIEFFPLLLWVIQNSNLKLEDKNGNTITEKEYMETALQTINGNSDSIEENNRTKSMVKNFFPERDCFIMMDSSHIALDVKNKININKKMIKYEEEINILKNKIIKRTKPKMFYNHFLTGNMLIELIESLLNNINTGGIPIMTSSWKYIMKSECMKIVNDFIMRFNNELRIYRNENINKNIFFNDNHIEKYKDKIIQKYIKEFMNNNIIDDEAKKEFSDKIKNKLEIELKKYEKENEKYFEEKFIKDLNLLSNKFMENFTSDIYEKNSYKFFQDFENFREAAVQAAPDFPQKNEILFNKVLLIIKKFINGKIMKIKVINDEKDYLENENKRQEEKLNELNHELNIIKEKNNEFIQKLNNDIQMEKKKYKRVEDKMNGLIRNKTKEIENLKKEIELETNNYENKIKEIIETNNNLDKEIKLKDEQLLVMKKNNEKITSLYEQKSKFLEREINSWKDKYTTTIKEGMLKENDLTKENLKLKEQNKILLKKEKSKREENNRNYNNNNNNINNNSLNSKHNNNSNKNINENINLNINGIDNNNINSLNNGNDNNSSHTNNSGNNSKKTKSNNLNGLMTYIKMNFKDKRSKMLKLDKFFLNRKKQSKERSKEKSKEKIEDKDNQTNTNNNMYFENDMNDSNHRENSLKSNKTKKNSFNNYDSNSSKEKNKKKVIDGQLINFTQYKDLINNAKDFKCKFCMKSFNFPDFKEHYNICPKNPINMNTMNNSNIHDNDSKEKNYNMTKMNSNSNTIFTSEKINNSHLDNDFNNDLSINKSTIKKFTLSNSSINTNHNSSINNIKINNINSNNLRNSNTKNINNNNSNNNGNILIDNSNRVSNTSNKVLNYRNKKDNSYSNNNLTNINTSNTINNSDNTSTFGTVVIENNNINSNHVKKGNYKNINLYFFDKNNYYNNNSNNIMNNTFIPQKLKIKIIKGRIRKDKSGKPYLEYIINISYDNIMNWNINRRFNQFTSLYKTLRTISKESFELPESSNIFNNITALFSGLSHENKIIQLEKFLKDLTETEGINNSRHLYWFLELNHLIDENNNINNNISNNNGIINNNHQRINIDGIPQNKNNNKNILITNNKHYYNSAGLSSNATGGINSAIQSNINSNINSNRFKIINGVLE